MNILDSRDLANKLKELRDERTTIVEAIEEAEEKYNDILQTETCDLKDNEQEAKDDLDNAKQELTDWDIDNKEELEELENLESEISEWQYGAAMIDEDDFVEYCQDMAEDIGAVGKNSDWIVIDWEATADNLKNDYSTVTYQGTDYLVRD